MVDEPRWDEIDNEEELSRDELTWFKERLMQERQRVLLSLKRHQSEAMNESEAAPDELDQALKLSDQATLMRLADKERKLMVQIEKALRKLETGDYGYCEGTGELIRRKRLKLRPWTRYSVAHKEQLELEKGRHRR